MQDLATHANPLSYLPWQETFFDVILKKLNTLSKLGQDKGNMLEVSSNHPLIPTCPQKCVKMQRKKSQHCQVSHFYSWKT
jgi:hypothetical protein